MAKAQKAILITGKKIALTKADFQPETDGHKTLTTEAASRLSGFIYEAHLPQAVTLDARCGQLNSDQHGSLYNPAGLLIFRASSRSPEQVRYGNR